MRKPTTVSGATIRGGWMIRVFWMNADSLLCALFSTVDELQPRQMSTNHGRKSGVPVVSQFTNQANQISRGRIITVRFDRVTCGTFFSRPDGRKQGTATTALPHSFKAELLSIR